MMDKQTTLKDLSVRVIPTGKLYPTKPQTDKPLPLEIPMIEAKEPRLF